MMIILSMKTMNMQRDPRILCKGLKDMRYHFARQVADFLSFKAKIDDSVRSI